MVDRASRDKLALGLRRLASGQMTVSEFEYLDVSYRDDPAISELWLFGCLHYSDYWPDDARLKGQRALDRAARRYIARTVLFLKSDREYVHGNAFRNQTIYSLRFAIGFVTCVAVVLVIGVLLFTPWWVFVLTSLATIYAIWLALHGLGRLLDRVASRERKSFPDGAGDCLDDYWPFPNHGALLNAIRHPVFLAGSRHP